VHQVKSHISVKVRMHLDRIRQQEAKRGSHGR